MWQLASLAECMSGDDARCCAQQLPHPQDWNQECCRSAMDAAAAGELESWEWPRRTYDIGAEESVPKVVSWAAHSPSAVPEGGNLPVLQRRQDRRGDVTASDVTASPGVAARMAGAFTSLVSPSRPSSDMAKCESFDSFGQEGSIAKPRISDVKVVAHTSHLKQKGVCKRPEKLGIDSMTGMLVGFEDHRNQRQAVQEKAATPDREEDEESEEGLLRERRRPRPQTQEESAFEVLPMPLVQAEDPMSIQQQPLHFFIEQPSVAKQAPAPAREAPQQPTPPRDGKLQQLRREVSATVSEDLRLGREASASVASMASEEQYAIHDLAPERVSSLPMASESTRLSDRAGYDHDREFRPKAMTATPRGPPSSMVSTSREGTVEDFSREATREGTAEKIAAQSPSGSVTLAHAPVANAAASSSRSAPSAPATAPGTAASRPQVSTPSEAAPPLPPAAAASGHRQDASLTLDLVLSDLESAENKAYSQAFSMFAASSGLIPLDSDAMRAFMLQHTSIPAEELDTQLIMVAPDLALTLAGFMKLLRDGVLSDGLLLEEFLKISPDGEAAPAQACRQEIPKMVTECLKELKSLKADMSKAAWEKLLDAVFWDAGELVSMEQWIAYCKIAARMLRLLHLAKM
eukprot:TRINITY_DN105885_c0_g1_i1.p1 TRINITY_DN105885_c0_g1~~TRINITY_DN105885_c0_g1_i1.p1  ORF type:complete len:644 (+),score=142.49 TRINITY_DN105885_c0_g1_i1:34-1932(+)